jgi:hypothetical protein
MKQYVGLFFVAVCLLNRDASGADSCFQTINQGAATVGLGAWEQSCASMSWTGGVITSDVKYNCCGPSTSVRINLNDFDKLRQDGKLDGLRYQKIEHGSNGYSLTFRKIVGKEITTINGEDFFK